uniref:ATP synthase F0 subunit 8 n=1 Tax=Issikiopteryx taipingensis TaxID=2939475 RepID=UPI002027CE20|nr:ATP synthase F0 subunit 8 [Issikiopteryx taipingensis]UPU95821.1 ATP synthase F0 subunit 8 [Issikiopteryx taipingensis]
MPQMMPINWMILFLLFICIFIIFNIMNYYIFNYKMNKNNMKLLTSFSLLKKKLNWKW